MNRHVVSIVIVLALKVTLTAFGQNEERARRTEQWQDIKQRWQNMSEEEREKFRAEMRERREKWESMSEEEREKFRAQMSERFGARRPSMGPEEQLKAIRIIEEQVAKLKAAVESVGPEARSRLRELSEEERAKLREKMTAAMRERQMAIREIEQQIARLRGPGRQVPEYRPRISELKAIHELAVKEKATETAERLEKLIAWYQTQSQGRVRPPESEPRGDVPRPRRERPVRREGDEAADAGKKAREFKLPTFDGKTISLSEYRGKIVVLEWLNFECPFVQYHYNKSTNTMIELANKYKGKNVVWLAVNSTSHTTPEANKAFAAKHKLPYPILDDRSGRVGHAYGAKTTPHMYIIDRRSNIVYEGAIDNSPNGRTPPGQELTNYVDKALSELLAGRAVSTPNTKPYGCTVKYPK